MLTNKITISISLVFIILILSVSGCNPSTVTKEKLVIVPADGSIPDRKNFDQNWDEKTRKNFWFTSQGSQILPYTWMVYLERAESDQLFRNVDHMNDLRFIPAKSSTANPGGLPIGMAPDYDQKTGKAWMGLTCSACHTNQLNYNGNKILIEGAPSLSNFTKFLDELILSLNSTYVNAVKFDRFAINILGTNHSLESRSELKEELFKNISKLAERQNINSLPFPQYPKDFIGYARIDAFGQIANQGAVFAIEAPLSNASIANAPVSFPFLWGTPQSDVVQWNGSAPNVPIVGPLARNMGEVVGVFGKLNINPAPWWKIWDWKHSYTSTTQIKALGNLEKWLVKLRSPRWKENYLPTVDPLKSTTGKGIYQNNCSGCHKFIDHSDEGNSYIATMTPVRSVKTDSTMAWNTQNHTAKTYILKGKKKSVLFGDKFGEETREIDIALNGVIGTILENPLKSLEAGIIPLDKKHLDDHLSSIGHSHLIGIKDIQNINVLRKSLKKHLDAIRSSDATLRYKARPLNGIWATAPYLHNGSVPNLWQLLQKPQDRIKSFYVGNRNFDPNNVGFETTEVPGSTSLFQVENVSGPIPGNSNAGHSYGTTLSDDEKWALIEFMKTL